MFWTVFSGILGPLRDYWGPRTSQGPPRRLPARTLPEACKGFRKTSSFSLQGAPNLSGSAGPNTMETGRFWPSALLGPEMVKFGPTFCYCAVDQKKAAFQWKWAVSGPSALLGPEMVTVGPTFCYCAVDQKKAAFQWKWAVSGPSALLGPEMVNWPEFLLLCCRF